MIGYERNFEGKKLHIEVEFDEKIDCELRRLFAFEELQRFLRG